MSYVCKKYLSSMPLRARCETTSIVFPHSFDSKKHHRRHHRTIEPPPRYQSPPFQCQTLIQDHRSLPLLQQRPRLCPPDPSTSTIDSTAISKSRRNASSSTAIDVLRLMDALRLPVEADTYASLLQECAISGDFAQGSAVHAHIRRRFAAGRSLLRDPGGLGLANRLLYMYAACHQAKLARQLFDEMLLRDSVSRIITMTALSESDDDRGALRLFAGMHSGREDWWLVDPMGFRVVLWSCARARELGLGHQLHGLAFKISGCSSFSDHSSPLIDFYAMLDFPDLSLKLILASSSDDCEEAAWVSVVSAYTRGGCFRKALLVFREMERRRRVGGYQKRKMARWKMIRSILAACAGTKEEKEGFNGGRQVHAIAVKIGVDGDPYVGRNLVELYWKLGFLVEARRAFDAVGGGCDAAESSLVRL